MSARGAERKRHTDGIFHARGAPWTSRDDSYRERRFRRGRERANPPVAKRRAIGDDARGGRPASPVAPIPPPRSFVRSPQKCFAANRCFRHTSTRHVLHRYALTDESFSLQPGNGASRDSSGMTSRVARLSSVPIEGDVDALSWDVLHAAAAQGTPRTWYPEEGAEAGGVSRRGSFTASRSRWWWAPRSGTRRPGSTGDAPASRAWCIYDWFGVRGRTFSSIPYTRRARNRAARILVGRRRGSVRQSSASRRQQRKREGRWCRALGRRGGRSAGREGAHPESRSFRRARGSPSNVAGPISRPRASCGVRPGATPASSSSLALRRGRLPDFCSCAEKRCLRRVAHQR